jgi:DNA polymerase-3 subunit gamma/tau
MYQTIPRRFRPQNFSSIVGQDAIVQTLKNGLKHKRIGHAYLFCGSRGTGKTTLARLLAKAVNCQNLSPDQEPCNTCPSCLAITQGHSLDVLEIDGASNRGIDDIRHLNETVGYASSSGQDKIYIIDEVHMLTKEAFNALLKTLEEPPENVKFFFATTEPHKVLPTIMSRCQRFDLSRITPAQIVIKLKSIADELGVKIETAALEILAHRSEGGLRDAESLLDQMISLGEGVITEALVSKTLGLTPRSIFKQLDEAISQDRLSFAFELAQTVFSSGHEIASFLDGLLDHYRNILLVKIGLPLDLPQNDQALYATSAKLYTNDQCLYILDYLTDWHKEIARAPFKKITLETILLHLIRTRDRIHIQTLVRKLEDLSNEPEVPVVIKPVVAKEAEKPAPPVVETKTPEPTALPRWHHDTVMQFAAVELEGTLRKE